ncbi:uncharacterized protein [Populus alba]|uniref:uncharacterized protein n=1 Tax=Populus alba TaxID=43335 RepID=UPI003CC731DA
MDVTEETWIKIFAVCNIVEEETNGGRWAHGDNKDEFLGFGGKSSNGLLDTEQHTRRDLLANDSLVVVTNGTNKIPVRNAKKIDVVLAKKGNGVSSNRRATPKKKSKRGGRRSRAKAHDKQKATVVVESDDVEVAEPDVPKNNASYGLLVGPFGPIEDRILEWSPEKRSGTCDRKGAFARLVWSRKFVLIFHELSMTGAPLSMLELATEFLSCGATVSAVVLSKKGGLMPELARRRIKVLEDRADLSFKTAMKADLVIAGSAVCTSWIDQYIARFPAGGSQVVWWIMENRREYFDRSKIILNRVKMLPAFACSLNTPTSSSEKMLEKRQLLRKSVRKEMGLTDNDMLVMSLSSINAVDKGNQSTLAAKHHLRALLEKPENPVRFSNEFSRYSESSTRLAEPNKMNSQLTSVSNSIDYNVAGNLDRSHRKRKLLADSEGTHEQALKVLIGSVGSKSNKVPYVKEILRFISQHSNLSKSLLWTPATTRVASLYSAADVYIINSQSCQVSFTFSSNLKCPRVIDPYLSVQYLKLVLQGPGETFGRVTIEAMAFGLPGERGEMKEQNRQEKKLRRKAPQRRKIYREEALLLRHWLRQTKDLD